MKNQYQSIVLLIILVSPVFSVHRAASGQTSWLYTFDNGLPDGWVISHGEIDQNTDHLETTSCVDWLRGACTASLWMEHSAITGRWSFDYYRFDNEESNFFLYFASQGKSTFTIDVHPSGMFPEMGFMVFILHSLHNQHYNDLELQFGRWIFNFGLMGDGYTDFDLDEGWIRIDIIRQEDGYMVLYIDGFMVIDATPSFELPNPEYINIQLSLGDKIDNFSYDPTVTSQNYRNLINNANAATDSFSTYSNFSVLLILLILFVRYIPQNKRKIKSVFKQSQEEYLFPNYDRQ